MKNLNRIAGERRLDVIEMLYANGGGHVGGDMSVMEILTTLYYEVMHVSAGEKGNPERDRFILSKGHCADALYVILGDLGYFDKKELLASFSAYGSPYIGHPNTDVPGIEVNGGSLGHGLSVGVGMALAAKRDGRSFRVYVVLGDGEMAEGSNYEAMMAAKHYGLDNLCATVDVNGLQISGRTEEVMSTASLSEKFHSFGWNVIEVERGNDCGALLEAYRKAGETKGVPTVLLAHTTKGNGISYMEHMASWHHGTMNEEQYRQAKRELEEAIADE